PGAPRSTTSTCARPAAWSSTTRGIGLSTSGHRTRAGEPGPPPARGGFPLLEVMVALAILASTLVVLLQIITNNVRATNHAKITTAASQLARSEMTDLEDQ